MFSEKKIIPKGKYSLGKILEIHKFTWPFVTLFFTIANYNFTLRMMLMNGYFSSYGLLWVLKSNLFYDKNFYKNEEHINEVIESVVNYLSISVYYLFPYVTSKNYQEIGKIETILSVMLYSLGIFLHYSADCQKFYSLKYQPGKLITDGLFKHIRHPNYSGEFLIWMSFILVSGKGKLLSYVPILWLYVATVISGIPKKEKSLSRYKDYDNWYENTNALIPKFF